MDLCQCDVIKPLLNKTPVLILQHPQEPDKDLGSARLSNLILVNSALKVGLSTPNLKHSLESAYVAGDSISNTSGLHLPAEAVVPSEWIVLFLGAKYKFDAALQGPKKSKLYFFDKNDNPMDKQPADIKGVVAIDGTWAQAKTMWWRNPWLLKLTRSVLDPGQTSLYGKLRKEPRRESLSTIEALAFTLEALGEERGVSVELLSAFRRLLQKFRDRGE